MGFGKLMHTITEFVCVGKLLRMRDPLPLPLDSKYHMFCFQSRVCKISVHFDRQKFPMLPLTDNRDPCNLWTFQLMVYKCGR